MQRLPGQGMNQLDAYHPQQHALGPAGAPPFMGPQRPPEPQGADGPLSLMWRRRWVVIMMLLLCIGGGIAYIRIATPLYTSTSRLAVSGVEISAMGGGGGNKAEPAAINFIQQQMAALDEMKKQVRGIVRKLKL